MRAQTFIVPLFMWLGALACVAGEPVAAGDGEQPPVNPLDPPLDPPFDPPFGTPGDRPPEPPAAPVVDPTGDAFAQRAAVGAWRLADSPVRATVTGGPWTLQQGPTTQLDPTADYPNPNPGTSFMQPYFWPQIIRDGQDLLGYFDYRPRKLQEAVVAARSEDGGRSWTFLQMALDFNPNPRPDPLMGNENGQGHPFVMRLRGQTLIYTLDRTPGVQDVGGLIVHRLDPTSREPLRGAPASEVPLSLATLRTTGLLNPDGIIAEVPDACGRGTRILYLQRILGSAGPLSDVTAIRLASTDDGIDWTDEGAVSGLQDDGTVFLGARGSLLRDRDDGYLLFFSGGTPADNASDAYRYIGYAVSTDLVRWTVVRGLQNPLLSTETTEASGAPQSWWAGRVFGPSVAIAPGGRQATMVFAGFATANASQDFSDYRQIGRVTLELTEAP
jgi:hypothetical protein